MDSQLSILLAIIGGLGLLLFRKSKQNTQLKAEQDLTDQKNRSKVVEEKVHSAQKKIDELSQELEKPVSEYPTEIDAFWKDYTKRKK